MYYLGQAPLSLGIQRSSFSWKESCFGLGADASEDVGGHLLRQELVSGELVSGYTLIESPDSIKNLQCPVSCCPCHPCALDLCRQSLVQYKEAGGSEFRCRFFNDRSEVPGGPASQEPGAGIELFNGLL